ncbi:MAG: hypothetical protein V9G98_22475 [Candidatus Competibacter sp.]
MGARAQEAVSFRSQLKDVDLLRLLGVLAAGADDDTGLIDPAPGRETLAGIFSCSERTITNRVGKLVESGELETVRVGSGPGRPSAYRILLPIPEVTCFNDERGKKGEKSSILEARVTALEIAVVEIKGEIEAKFFTLLQAIEELKGEIASLKGEKGGKGEAEREKGGSLKGESLPEVERGRSFTILTSPNGEVDPHTDSARAGEPDTDPNVDREQDFWDKALRLVTDWQGLTGSYRSLDVTKSTDKAEFYAPALGLITEFDGDYAAAWTAVKAEYERMVGDGLNVRRLSAISSGVMAELTRARLPRSDPATQLRPGKASTQGAAVESFEVFLDMMQGVET